MNLFPYQEKAKNWLKARDKGYLAAAMGLGKSAISLRAVNEMNAYPLLIVCPAMVRTHWARECEKWLGKKAEILTYRTKRVPEISIISYEHAVKLISHHPEIALGTLIFDEAHYLKSPDAIRTKTLLIKKESLASRAKRVYFLSGTPAPNHVGELWPALFSLGAVKERYTTFTSRYCEFQRIWLPNRRHVMKITGSYRARIPELKKRIAPFLMRITHDQANVDLPKVSFSEFSIEGSLGDARVSEGAFEDRLSALSSEEDSLLVLQAMAPSLATLRRMHALRKVLPTARLVEEELSLGLYDKILVFAHHHEVLEGLHGEFQKRKISAVIAHGGHSAIDRSRAVDLFQSPVAGVQVFLGSILATGVGINLHAARTVLFVEQDYVPGNNAQAIARSARLGQLASHIQVRWLVLSDSGIDQRISEILAKKTMDLRELFE